MANNYIQFCAELILHSQEERKWLKRQLEDVEVATLTDPSANDDRPRSYVVPPEAADYREGYELAGTFPRFLSDMSDLDVGYEGPGFECEWDERDEPGSVVFFAEESGCPDRVGYLVQKYLQEFHPDKCWSHTWSETCSKFRVGEFGGGGMLVTARRLIPWNAHAFVDEQQDRFERISRFAAQDDHPDFHSAAWTRAVSAGQTRLGYWEWVLDQLTARENEILKRGHWRPDDSLTREPDREDDSAS